jgi:hypothetical protein
MIHLKHYFNTGVKSLANTSLSDIAESSNLQKQKGFNNALGSTEQ